MRSFDAVPLARLLSVTTEQATELRVRATAADQGFEVSWPEAKSEHEVPILGLKPARSWEVEVFLDGRRVETFSIDTPALPSDFPEVEVRAYELASLEPGYRMTTARRLTNEGTHYLVALDVDDLEVAWYTTANPHFGDVRRTARGTLLGLRPTPEETDFLMRTLRRWTPEPGLPNDVLLPASGAHHELFPLEDGSMLTLNRMAHTSAAYPSSVDTPEVRDQEATLISHRVVHFDRQGTLLAEMPLAGVLDDGRISMSSLDREPGEFGFDWLHANAVIPDADGAVVVSARHQDALVKLDADGQLVWILGDPAGWGEAFAPYLLRPDGDVTWSYHPHAPAWDADGNLVVFDNHNFGHTPYGEVPAEPWSSRVVTYAIDEAAGTVREVWSFDPGGLQSPRMGDADPLPVTGNVLATFGWIEEGERDAEDLPEEVSMRLIELDPETQVPLLDLWLRAPDDGGPPGVRSYRSESVSSLYTDNADFQKFDP